MITSGTTPLIEAFPWSREGGTHPSRHILVTDSIEADGRFLLHSIASQTLNNTAQNSVMWLSCGPLSEKLIATALRKMGCDAASAYLKHYINTANPWKGPLVIHAILGEAITLYKDEDQLQPEVYLRHLYQRIRSWRAEISSQGSRKHVLLVLDDVSALGNLLGERLVYFFISYLRALEGVVLLIRCSNSSDKGGLDFGSNEPSLTSPRDRSTLWFGSGGTSSMRSTGSSAPWERSLLEFVDWVVDVLPLTSGYSREAHGRLVFTSIGGVSRVLMNYRLEESAISAICLQISNSLI